MTQKGYYIGFGLNAVDDDRYMGWDGKLNAAEFDIRDLSGIAKNLGFETKVFLGKQATIANLRQAFADARQWFDTEGGVLWFNYSGHGGQIMNLETLCLYDQQMLDTALRNELKSFKKSVRCIAFLDCCHSGGMERNLFGGTQDFKAYRTKAMPVDAAIMAADNVEKGVVVPPKGQSVIKYLCACQKDQSAFDGRNNGVFTAAFKVVFQRNPNLSYGEIMAEVTKYIEKMQKPRLVTVPNEKIFKDSVVVFQ